MPLALVTTVLASNAVKPNEAVRVTTVPAPTALPLASLTRIVSVTGNAAVTEELLKVSNMDGASATSCTTSELVTTTVPTVALAVRVSAAVTVESSTAAVTLAKPKASVLAEGAPSLTRPPTDVNVTSKLGTGLPAASLTNARTVSAPVAPRSVVELIVKAIVGSLPATVKLMLPCTVVVPSLTTAST